MENKKKTGTQIGGDHYEKYDFEPSDIIRNICPDYFLGSAIKYILRYKDKNGQEDLLKALDCLRIHSKKYEKLNPHEFRELISKSKNISVVQFSAMNSVFKASKITDRTAYYLKDYLKEVSQCIGALLFNEMKRKGAKGGENEE